jgi:hypothetical protein
VSAELLFDAFVIEIREEASQDGINCQAQQHQNFQKSGISQATFQPLLPLDVDDAIEADSATPDCCTGKIQLACDRFYDLLYELQYK